MLTKIKNYLLPIIIKFFVLDFVIKGPMFVFREKLEDSWDNQIKSKSVFGFKNVTGTFHRGALILWNLLSLTIISFIIFSPDMKTFPLISKILLSLWVLAVIISITVSERTIHYKNILKYGHFTQIVAADTHYNNVFNGNNIASEDLEQYHKKVEWANEQWVKQIDNKKYFNIKLIWMHPVYNVLITALLWFLAFQLR